MTTPPLQLEEQFYQEVSVKAREDHDPVSGEQGKVLTEVYWAQHADDDDRWRVDLHLAVVSEEGSPPPGYEVKVHSVGGFWIQPEFPPDLVEDLIRVTATSMLYSGMRDLVHGITARGPWEPLLLPTTSFVDGQR